MSDIASLIERAEAVPLADREAIEARALVLFLAREAIRRQMPVPIAQMADLLQQILDWPGSVGEGLILAARIAERAAAKVREQGP